MFWAFSMPVAVQRSAISASRQRLTLRPTGENSGISCRDGLADELGQRGGVRCAGRRSGSRDGPRIGCRSWRRLYETEESITAVVSGPGPDCAGDLAPGGATLPDDIFAELRL